MKPLRSLGREERSPIRHMILDLQPTSLDRVYAILLAVMLRLAVPGEFLDDVPAILSGFPSAAKAELQSRLTVFIMGDMDRRATTAVQVGDGDLNLRAEKAEILISALAAGEKAILTGDRDTRKQLTAVRGTAVEIVTGIVREADKSVRGGIVADGLGDLDTLKRAEDSVRALRRCDRQGRSRRRRTRHHPGGCGGDAHPRRRGAAGDAGSTDLQRRLGPVAGRGVLGDSHARIVRLRRRSRPDSPFGDAASAPDGIVRAIAATFILNIRVFGCAHPAVTLLFPFFLMRRHYSSTTL
jgi:hypothetical protein